MYTVSLSGRQYFNIPHSLALSEQYNAVCVADRENGRVLCYRYDSGKFITQVDKVFGGQVFAIAFSTDGNSSLLWHLDVDCLRVQCMQFQCCLLLMDQSLRE